MDQGKPFTSLLLHRIAEVEKAAEELETRVRALEIAQARLIGYAAGGAFAGGLVWQIVTWFAR
jgi:hypothetical protein